MHTSISIIIRDWNYACFEILFEWSEYRGGLNNLALYRPFKSYFEASTIQIMDNNANTRTHTDHNTNTKQ